MGLAKPTVTSLRALLGGASSAVVVVLDNSSQHGHDRRRADAAGDGRRRRRTDARRTRRPRSGRASPNQRPAVPRIGPTRPHQEKVRQILAQCRTSYERADLAAGIRKAREMLLPVDAPNRVIYVITDMQKLSWEASSVGLTRKGSGGEGGRGAGRKSPSSWSIAVGPPKPNVAVEGMDCDVPAPSVSARQRPSSVC